jgi:hypothetical protein
VSIRVCVYMHALKHVCILRGDGSDGGRKEEQADDDRRELCSSYL